METFIESLDIQVAIGWPQPILSKMQLKILGIALNGRLGDRLLLRLFCKKTRKIAVKKLLNIPKDR